VPSSRDRLRILERSPRLVGEVYGAQDGLKSGPVRRRSRLGHHLRGRSHVACHVAHRFERLCICNSNEKRDGGESIIADRTECRRVSGNCFARVAEFPLPGWCPDRGSLM